MSDLLTVIDTLAADDAHGLAETVLLNRAETLLEARNRLDAQIARTAGPERAPTLLDRKILTLKPARHARWVTQPCPNHRPGG